MSDERKTRGWKWWTALTVIVLVAYVLTSGPVGMVCNNLGWDDFDASFYSPIYWSMEQSVTVADFMFWYWSWFPVSVP